MQLVTSEEMKNLDKYTIETIGISGLVLMELAGNGATSAIADRWEIKDTSVLVIAGTGNNGGDGFVVARHLFNKGAHVQVILLGQIQEIKNTAAVNLSVLQKLNIPIIEVFSSADIMDFEDIFSHIDIIVDAIFGIGLDRNITGLAREIITMINASPAIKVALDMPSGINANSGKVMGLDAIRADLTVTFGYPKIGQFTSPGFEYCGEIEVVDISIPPYIKDKNNNNIIVLTDDFIESSLKIRQTTGHKGTYGHCLIMAGSAGKVGAAIMTSEATVTMGSGLVTILSDYEIFPVLMNRVTEIMLEAYNSKNKTLTINKALQILNKKSVMAIGPGISKDENTKNLIFQLIESSTVPLVLDAEALNFLSENNNNKVLKKANCPIVITPHTGEMSRLTGIAIKDIQNNRVNVALKFAQEYGVYVVLKGARTVIASPDGNIAINPTGNPGMATGGSGDVLTGFITSLIGQKYNPFKAACIAVFLHGRAGDLSAEEKGELSIKASDLIEYLPYAIFSLTSSDFDTSEI